MSETDELYKRMADACDEYYDKVDALRDQVYGYTTRLDIIVPFSRDLFSYKDNYSIGADAFCETIVQYCQSFSGDTAKWFDEGINDSDAQYISDLSLCILYYLKTQCRSSDYTFLGFNKLIKSFLGTVEEERKTQKEASTFWHIYDMMSESAKADIPERVRNAFDRIYAHFNYDYAYRMAYCVRYAVRYFLYTHKCDYISDPLMQMATLDMIEEVCGRLNEIQKNRKPRRSRR